MRSHLHIAWDQAYFDEQAYLDLTKRCLDVSRMLGGLIRYLKRSDLRGAKYR